MKISHLFLLSAMLLIAPQVTQAQVTGSTPGGSGLAARSSVHVSIDWAKELSLPQTPFGWRVTPNRVMLLLNERYFQADFASGHRAFPIKGFA